MFKKLFALIVIVAIVIIFVIPACSPQQTPKKTVTAMYQWTTDAWNSKPIVFARKEVKELSDKVFDKA